MNKALTVAELIEELKKMPQDMEVYFQGSEWIQAARSVGFVAKYEIDYKADGDVVCLFDQEPGDR